LDIGFDVQLEQREDLMETAVAIDLIALCQGPGPYLPRPYQDGPDVSSAAELRHDAVTLADHLVRYDHQHDGGRTRTLPPSLPAQPDAQAQEDVRAYARREWLYSLTADFADLIDPSPIPSSRSAPNDPAPTSYRTEEAVTEVPHPSTPPDTGRAPAGAGWVASPPGDTREQLAEHILGIIDVPPYTSTACEAARACQHAIEVHDEHDEELRSHVDGLHQRCRRNNKFTGELCNCGCHY
jgi:hypothetical protein